MPQPQSLCQKETGSADFNYIIHCKPTGEVVKFVWVTWIINNVCWNTEGDWKDGVMLENPLS